MDAPHEP
jgi:Homing endonuclease associated repeat